jgi:hypothetical protein
VTSAIGFECKSRRRDARAEAIDPDNDAEVDRVAKFGSYIPLNMTEMIMDKDKNALAGSDLVWSNVTLSMQIKNFRDHKVFEQVDEVCLRR